MKSITLAVVVAHAIIVFALGAVVLRRGIKRRCKVLLRFSAVYFGLSALMALIASEAIDWVMLSPVLLFSVLSMLHLDKAIERLNKPKDTDSAT
jgi:hypothetical protein